ncbi:hypothetical protein [Bacillus sp. AFS040349]|uniref:hypothetical protein n=1 Tax=Bacillus sp. AFS040349 TaxID=2033502 RepID=UPI000BFCB502|nr:hypothetical protein [Bacillus sp. AFS040349]PGT80570.1 hypothetical protein COD11_20890 [Bacillus sp. AFS040349]
MVTFEETMKNVFIEVFKAYVDRKYEKILVLDNPQRVVRGTIVSNSSVYENQLALLLSTQLSEEYRILVDYPIIFPGQNNRITPDILIMKDNTIQMILELKIDLGYEKQGWENARENRLNKLKIHQHETAYKPYNEKTREKGEKVSINVPDHIEYGTVIFCQKNGAKKIKEVIKGCKSCDDNNKECDDRTDYPFFILLKDPNKHPNDFTSIDDAIDYLCSMKKEDISDWKVFENYLRNRLAFVN